MNKEVSVAELLVREGWGDHVPPPAKSRWRVIAVMVAVVAGCGAAALLVQFGAPSTPQADEKPQIGVIHMPNRTDGAGGADESAQPETSGTTEAGSGGGTGDRPTAGAGNGGTVEQTTHDIDPTPSTDPTSSVVTTTPTGPRGDPPTGTTSAPGHSSPPVTHTTEAPCLLWIICAS